MIYLLGSYIKYISIIYVYVRELLNTDTYFIHKYHDFYIYTYKKV